MDKKQFSNIDMKIAELKDNPRPHGVKKLKDHLHRIRIGAWRVIYLIDDATHLVSILDVLRRSERTYKRLRAGR